MKHVLFIFLLAASIALPIHLEFKKRLSWINGSANRQLQGRESSRSKRSVEAEWIPLYNTLIADSEEYRRDFKKYFQVLKDIGRDGKPDWPSYWEKREWLKTEQQVLNSQFIKWQVLDEEDNHLTSDREKIRQTFYFYSGLLAVWEKQLRKQQSSSGENQAVNSIKLQIYRIRFSMIKLFDEKGNFGILRSRWSLLRGSFLESCRQIADSSKKISKPADREEVIRLNNILLQIIRRADEVVGVNRLAGKGRW